ncbi:C-reactive protein-like [Penaeus monodon]|uniref:C-reactive protein-like n=1 Tax=Penaeus monodon TaxID=6687 RepID=UPI0018A6F1C2|nr:C-reactive protein-like [Penaeus monodon]
MTSLSAFTICYRIRLFYYRRESVVLSYAISDEDNNIIRLDHTTRGFRMQLVGALNTSGQSTPLWHWCHYCLAANLSSGDWAMAIQGEITIRDQGDIRLINKSIDGDGVLILGQDQDVLGGGFQEDQSLSGEISALHIWDYALDDVTINDIANFQSNLQGQPQLPLLISSCDMEIVL